MERSISAHFLTYNNLDFCNGKSLEIGTNQATNQADQGANQVRNMKIEILNAIYENSKIMQEQIAKKLNVKISSIKYYSLY